jgi:methylmalonyl-CoA mutase
MSKFLFNDFDEVSAKQWKQQIQFELKGADYNETLVWQSPEGINVKPFYHQDDFNRDFQPIPGQPESWKIAQKNLYRRRADCKQYCFRRNKSRRRSIDFYRR